MLTERQIRYIIARAEYTCDHDDCTNQATLVQLQYPEDQLRAFHRDPDAPDNYCAICTQHHQQQVVAGLNILSAIAGLVFFIFMGLILFALITA